MNHANEFHFFSKGPISRWKHCVLCVSLSDHLIPLNQPINRRTTSASAAALCTNSSIYFIYGSGSTTAHTHGS